MDPASQTWSWDELATKFLTPRLKDVCPHELTQHQLRVLHVVYTVTMVRHQDNFLDWFYKTIDTYEAIMQSAKTQIPYPGPSDPHWPLTHEQTFIAVHFLPPIESPLNLQSGDCFFQAPVSSQIGTLSFKYVKGGTVVPTSIGPQSFNVAFTKTYFQQIISMLSLSHDLSESTFSLLLVGAKGTIERYPLLEFATPRLKGMFCAKVHALSTVGDETTEKGLECYPDLEEMAAKQLDMSVKSLSPDAQCHSESDGMMLVSSPLQQHCNLKRNSDETPTQILHCYENGVVKTLQNVKQDLQQTRLERELARLRTDVNQLRDLMAGADSCSVGNIQMVADLSETNGVDGTRFLKSESKFKRSNRDNVISQARQCLPAKIKDIGFGMRSVISSKLDTLDSRFKDWRLVADGLGFSNDDIKFFRQAYSGSIGQSSPTMLMLETCGDTLSDSLVEVLDDVDRIDVLEVVCQFQQQNDRLSLSIDDIPPEKRDVSDPDILHLYDDAARELWLKLPGSRLEKSWKDIYTALCHKAGRISPTVEKALFYFLCSNCHVDFGKRKDCGVMVRMEAFTRVVKWFGPLTADRRGFIQKIEQLLSKSIGSNKMSWFAGHMSRSDACARLENTKCGTFLVRFSETYADMGGFVLDIMANGEIESFHIDALPARGILYFPYGDHKDEDFESLLELIDQLKTIPVSSECPITLVAACPDLPFSRQTRGYHSRAK